VDKPQRELRPDIAGLFFAALGFGALQYLANEGERRNWLNDGGIVLAVGILIAAVCAFVVWELYLTDEPLINLRLLVQKRNLAAGAAMNLILGMVGYSVVSFVAYLETSTSATATLAGAMILLRLSTYIVGITVAFMLVKQRILSVRAVIVVAAVGSAFAFLGFAENMTSTADAGTFVVISLIFGLFFSMLSQPVPAVVLGTLGMTDLGAGLSLYKLSAPVGTSIGTGIFQTLLDHRTAAHGTDLAGYVTSSSVSISQYLSGGGNAGALATLVSGQAQALAFEDVMRVFAVCVLLTIPIIFIADTRPAPTK
jgi:DHA2 family multidrug resistance protein